MAHTYQFFQICFSCDFVREWLWSNPEVNGREKNRYFLRKPEWFEPTLDEQQHIIIFGKYDIKNKNRCLLR